MTKRLLAAALLVLSGKLKVASEWCGRKSLKLFGFDVPPPPPPAAVDQMMQSMAGGCLNCGSLFAVKAEFDAHQCPRKASA